MLQLEILEDRFAPATLGVNSFLMADAVNPGTSQPATVSIATSSYTPIGTTTTETPTFSWPAVTGAAQYEIHLGDLTTKANPKIKPITGTSWIPVQSLLSGHSYHWRVRPLFSTGSPGPWSATVDFTVALPTLIGPNNAVTTLTPPTFTWNGVTGAPKYEIYVSDLTTAQVQDQTVAGTTWTPTTPLVSGHGYRWWVRAVNSDGKGGLWTSSVDFTAPLPTLVGPNDTVTTFTPAFTWNGVTGAAQYEIYVSDLATSQIQDQMVAGTTWTPTTPLLWGHGYRWWVRAVNSDGKAGLWSSSVDFGVALPTLIGPNSTVSTLTPAFTWNGVAGAAQYEIYVSDLTTAQVQDQTVTGTTWTPTTPLVSGHGYRWWVRALNSDGKAGLWSSSVDFGVALPTLIGPNSTASTLTPAFTWNGVPGAAQYEIYVSDLTTAQVQDQTVTGTTWTPTTPLVSGHGYRWWVRALNSDGKAGLWTSSVDFTAPLPTLVGPSSTVTTLTPAFTWNGVPGAPKYEIYVSDLTTAQVQDQTVTGTTWTPTTPLVSGHGYHWWIRALNSDGKAGLWTTFLDFQVS